MNQWLGREPDDTLLSSVEVKNAYPYRPISTFRYVWILLGLALAWACASCGSNTVAQLSNVMLFIKQITLFCSVTTCYDLKSGPSWG